MIVPGKSKPSIVVWCNGRFYRRPGGNWRLEMHNPYVNVMGFNVPERDRWYEYSVNGETVYEGDQGYVRWGRRYPDVQHVYLDQSEEWRLFHDG